MFISFHSSCSYAPGNFTATKHSIWLCRTSQWLWLTCLQPVFQEPEASPWLNSCTAIWIISKDFPKIWKTLPLSSAPLNPSPHTRTHTHTHLSGSPMSIRKSRPFNTALKGAPSQMPGWLTHFPEQVCTFICQRVLLWCHYWLCV